MTRLSVRSVLTFLSICFGISVFALSAQDLRVDVEREVKIVGNTIEEWRKARAPFRPRFHFLPGDAGVWWRSSGAADQPGGFVRVDADGKRRAARTRAELELTQAADAKRSRRRGTRRQPRDRARYRFEIREHDLWMWDRELSQWRRLTKDGTAADPYQTPRHWSPNGRFVLGFRRTVVDTREVAFVESSPKGQVQPKLHTLRYRKPGDAIPQARPRLIDLAARRVLPAEDSEFADSYRVRFLRWSPDSTRAYVLYNRRGHQELSLRAIDAATGAVTTIVTEQSETFVDYSQKTWVHFTRDGREVLWMSERDGWNHLYRFDARTGADLGRLTKGRWVVRKVEHVDEERGLLWFTAMGIHRGQDPYHRHLARVRLDGSDLRVLTDADGDHEWKSSPSRKLLVVRWSRVDHAPVVELRDGESGRKIAELGREDDSALRAAGFTVPERFVAKGRDGTSDIHGILIRPSKFDRTRRYPVLEAIYAGPHGHHVPKRFGLSLRNRRLAELGFIVVQIDGMGTNWRSKAFHDVCWQNLKDAGFADRIAWMRAAARAHPELDLSRVGIYGGSAGGQNALAALLHHGDFYKAAVSDCGCHDNRMDKIWWNEAWMGELGPHYADSSNVTHAAKLRGKLLLTVGELDRNVDPASTMQVVDALMRANKDFEMFVVPGGGHGVGERPYLVRKRQAFFMRHLMGAR